MADSNSLKLFPCSEEEYSPIVKRIKRESGDKSYPIWLLVNPKYFADYQEIWAPVLDEIQDKVYRKLRKRIDTSNILIKNAVSDIGIVSKTVNHRAIEAAKETAILKESLLAHQPKILITFGTIANEFVKRVFDISPEKGPKYWSTANLGDEFELAMANFNINQTNRIPLQRKVMKSGRLRGNRSYCNREDNEKYFRIVGAEIAERIIENKDNLKIWIE